MAAATQQQQQRQQPPATEATPLSSEEEALKRNTDCVYFLASPLTCKKGSECEYRHSEYARVNPRDCYFWMNGNCLNPKCGFRHPPLDGLFGVPAATASAGSSLPPLQTIVAPPTHNPYNSSKQAVPCVFFQKGLCLKGDRCAFSHGPNTSSNKVSQTSVATFSSEAQPKGKHFGGLQRCTEEQNILSKAANVHIGAKPTPKAGVAPLRNSTGVERNTLKEKLVDDEVPRYKPTITPVNGNPSRNNRLHLSQAADDQSFQNGKDYDDLLRESSPGFDVLVDDEMRDSDYYHGEDPEGRKLNSVEEYELGHMADYGSMTNIDLETYRDPRAYDSFEHMQGQRAWEQQRASSERMLGGPVHRERRAYGKVNSPEHIDESDLRYRLSKHRRVNNGLRSVVSQDSVPNDHIEERGYQVSSRRNSHRESSTGSRLQGRIKLPGRSLNSGSDERDKGRNWGRLSSGGSQISSHQGRLRDRLKSRVEEDYNNEGIKFRHLWMGREIMDQKSTDFDGPKSLAELKVTKHAEGSAQQSLGKRKHVEDSLPSASDLSFEGPMPLSEILKRKREAEVAASDCGASSASNHCNKQNEREEDLNCSSDNAAVAEPESSLPYGAKDDRSHVIKDKGHSKSAEAFVSDPAAEQSEMFRGQSSHSPNLNKLGSEDGMTLDNVTEDHDYNGEDQRDGDYEYEEGDEGDYSYDEGEIPDAEEGENADVEEEYVDDEEGDDFAKKIGAMSRQWYEEPSLP
ncbi:hypothetical protein K2173_009271 [Erythroxylum novogranatense]|uniref:C3H1-type domain-containing protein n=1 Tax=Erythroxylum novogranatense TaxID=1862640 RepID=A0AAV8T001_9ROSI|nr:hypothetical protein K2173_009271 [Erythroxylum novogranatense]